MMFARCPACQTVFRVRPEQLRAHRGEVRCGRCQAPFNALEHLLEADSLPVCPPPPAPEVIERAPPLHAVPSAASIADELPGDNFFVLEERRSDSVGNSAQAAVNARPSGAARGPVSRAGDETTVPPVAETPPPLVASASDRTRDALDFEIPEKLLVPRRPLRTSDLLRREPAIGEPAIEAPPIESAAPGDEPPPVAGAPSFPEFIDLSDLEPDHPATEQTDDGSRDEMSGFGRRVPFDAWAQRVRSSGGDRSETGTGTALPPDGGHVEPAIGGQPDRAPEPQPARRRSSEEFATAFVELPESHPLAPGKDSAAVAPSAVEAPPTIPLASDDELETARLDAAYGPRPASLAKRWLLGLRVGLLLGVLGVQAAYLFRAEITREWPQLRPAYLAACEALGCTVPLPRIADLVGIATSDLQSEPGRQGHFILNATVRNRAPHPQAYPHLEMTLTDAQDRPVVRRVLEPREWVPPRQLQQASVEDGFRGGSEIAVKVPFEAEDVAAVGYRLYVFYP